MVGDRIVPTIETVSSFGRRGKHLFECVATFAGEIAGSGLNICSIEGMFGTQVRIRRLRPRSGCGTCPLQQRAGTSMTSDHASPAHAGIAHAARAPRLRLTPRGRAVFGDPRRRPARRDRRSSSGSARGDAQASRRRPRPDVRVRQRRPRPVAVAARRAGRPAGRPARGRRRHPVAQPPAARPTCSRVKSSRSPRSTSR